MEEKGDSQEKSLLCKKRERTKNDEVQLSKAKKQKNRKRLLKNKLEFFLSDLNLYHDNYLKEIYLSNNSSLTPEIFLTFNSIKDLLKDIKNDSDKKKVIIKSIEISRKLIYNKKTNEIRRKYPYQENSINNKQLDKSTIFVQNFPDIINHDIIYKLFKDFKILYIQLLKGKNNLYIGDAFITFKNEEDVKEVISKYNNSIPKIISELKPKVLKPLKIITKEEYLKNNIIENNDKNNIKEDEKIKKRKLSGNKNNNNIDENALIKINNIKNNLTLNSAKKCLFNITIPQFIDINNNEKTMILRFDSKETSELFLSKLKENNYYNIKDILEKPIEDNNNISIYELNEKEKTDYLNIVKEKINNYKENKKKQMKKENKMDN